jgi:modulator of FtsH protease HflK
MAWNEPGDDKKKNDPWTNSEKNTGKQSPPDLDEMLKKWQAKLSSLLGNKRQRQSGGNVAALKKNSKGANLLIVVALLVLLVIWALSGIFIVEPAERAVILRFGKYIETVGPGAHWIPRIVESYEKLNVEQVRKYPYSALMLTKDENIVSVALVVQYKVSDAFNYFFQVVNPTESLQQATASALRQVIGNTTLDDILTIGREQVRQQVYEQVTAIIDSYKAGIFVTDVAMQPASAPEEVKDAFDDAIKAQEDEQRFINQAQAYAMSVVPKAQGQAKRLEQEAIAYQQQVVLDAEGSTARYLAILPEYLKAPNVTRERMYIDTIEQVLSNTSKVYIDAQAGNNLLYLPIDKILAEQAKSGAKKITLPNSLSQANHSLPMRSRSESSNDYGYGNKDYDQTAYSLREVR